MNVNNFCRGKGYTNYGNRPWYKFANVSAVIDTRCSYCKSVMDCLDPVRSATMERLEKSKFTSIDCDSIKDRKFSGVTDGYLTVQFTNSIQTVPFLPNPTYKDLHRHGVYVINMPEKSGYRFNIELVDTSHWFTYQATVGSRQCIINGGIPLYYKNTIVSGFETGTHNNFVFIADNNIANINSVNNVNYELKSTPGNSAVIKIQYSIWKKESKNKCFTQKELLCIPKYCNSGQTMSGNEYVSDVPYKNTEDKFIQLHTGTMVFYLMHEKYTNFTPAVDYQMHLLNRFVLAEQTIPKIIGPIVNHTNDNNPVILPNPTPKPVILQYPLPNPVILPDQYWTSSGIEPEMFERIPKIPEIIDYTQLKFNTNVLPNVLPNVITPSVQDQPSHLDDDIVLVD